MSKFYLTKIFAFILLLVLSVSFIFFRKDKNNSELSKDEMERQRIIESVKEQEKNNELPEEDKEKNKIKATAENFAAIYYSYTWGNFSNIESQYYYMTDEMKNREIDRVEKMKGEMENQARRYFTVRAKLMDSNFIYYEKKKAAVNVNLSIDNINGAMAQRDTMVWVDEKGEYYSGDIKDLVVKTVNKNIEVNLIKIGGEWKVDKIAEK